MPPPQLSIKAPRELRDILLTIRLVESGDRYDAPPNRAGASGAYQYIASTWANFHGYPAAHLAPPGTQDARALADVRAILDAWKGDLSMVPVLWYYPRAAREPALMDVVPMRSLGNRLTVREYQHRWLDMFAFITGKPISYRPQAKAPEVRFLEGNPPEFIDQPLLLGEIAFPVLGRTVLAPTRSCAETECEDGAPAIVYGDKLQPVLAATDGVVTAAQLDDPISGAVTLTITDRHGRTFTYSGFNNDSPGTSDDAAHPSLRLTVLGQVGATVRAGQIIGYLGDTDPMPSDEHHGVGLPSAWPHIRLTIRDRHGDRLDADVLVAEAQVRQACHVGIGPWSISRDPRLADVDRSVRDHERVDIPWIGSFILRRDGTVTALARSALILPPEGCIWSPGVEFGPGGSGAGAPGPFYETIDLPGRSWVNGVFGDRDRMPFTPARGT